MRLKNEERSHADAPAQGDRAVLLGIAAALTLVHLLTNSRYGFHRDELQFLSDAMHLDWGFVAYPPLDPFLERIGLGLFGVSLVGLRLFSVMAQAAAVFVTGLMAYELGGRRLAQVSAALAVSLSPLPLFNGTEFQYTSFDYLWWVLVAYFVIRLLKSQDPRWWLSIGFVAGLGLLTKYTILFLLCGVLGGLVLTSNRRYFISKWFWMAIGLAFLIFLPNLLWQVHHGFISLHFLQHIHSRDVGQGRANGFLRDQLLICINLFAAPVCIAGLIAFIRNERYRMLAWMYVIPLVLFVVGKGRGYYLAAAYPPLMAMGAEVGERWIQTLPLLWRRIIGIGFLTGLTACGLLVAAVILPISSKGQLHDFALKNNGDLREEFGWNELVQGVANVRDSLTPAERSNVGILVGNYGEQGAIEILGRARHLPPPISMTNSAWLRSYPARPPSALIVIGFSREQADKAFTACRLVAHNSNSEGIENEESRSHPDIFVCAGPRLSWPAFWKQYQSFG